MQFISENKITGTPTSTHPVLSTYTTANLLSENPGRRWISTCPADQIRINVNSSTSACFLGNVRADGGTYKFLSTAIALSGSTAITQANPAVVTTASDHNLTTGDQVFIEGCVGMVDINDQIHTITVLTTTTFSLDGVDSSAFTAHTAGTGSLYKVNSQGDIVLRETRNYTQFFQGTTTQLFQSWLDLDYSSDAGILIIDLKNTFDKRSATLSKWTSPGSDVDGRFETSGSVAIVLDDQINVNVGSVVFFDSFANTTVREVSRDGVSGRLKVRTNTANSWLSNGDDVFLDGITFNSVALEISNKCFEVVNVDNGGPFTFELVGTEQTFCTLTGLSASDIGAIQKPFQITRILGDGTGTTGVRLSPDPGSASLDIREILYSASVGIATAGFALNFPNAQQGAVDNRQSFSVREEIANGALSVRNRNIVRQFGGTLLLTSADFFRMKEFADSIDALPFACLTLDDLDTNSRHAMYCIFTQPPAATYSSRKLRSVSFELREFI